MEDAVAVEGFELVEAEGEEGVNAGILGAGVADEEDVELFDAGFDGGDITDEAGDNDRVETGTGRL